MYLSDTNLSLGLFSSVKCASYLYLDEWAADMHLNGQLVKAAVIGNVETEMRKRWMSFLKTDRREIGSPGKLRLKGSFASFLEFLFSRSLIFLKASEAR